MSHKNKAERHIHHSKSREWMRTHAADASSRNKRPALEIVLKGDSDGSIQAAAGALSKISVPEADITIIHSGIGDIHKSDILIAETGSRLIAGFQVGVETGMEKLLWERGVEVRLYDVIYRLTEDIEIIAKSIIPHVPEEHIIGTARVIALFKSSRKGIIIGCDVLTGHLAHGQHFRVISAMGPVYAGAIESMQREKNVIQKALPGQQVGIKIRNFNRVTTGDLVESYKAVPLKEIRQWKPRGGIIRIG
jgi:translation initiation factor IF-2